MPELKAWCGWIRFEGHGGCVIRKEESSAADIIGNWKVVDASTVRLISSDSDMASSLLVREGPDPESICVTLEQDSMGSAIFKFVPEEDGDSPMRHQ